MSIARKITEGASGSGGSGKYVDDVFSTYLYEGTGADRDIVNGIDLDDKGGLVWIKERTGGNAAAAHAFTDTERGAGKVIASTRADAEYTTTTSGSDLTSFNSDGFSLGPDQYYYKNLSSQNYVSWTFAKQEGFFDVVTYTGDGVMGREIPHALGTAPGMMIIKSTSATGDWYVWHSGLQDPLNQYLRLNSMKGIETNSIIWGGATPTSSEFTIGSSSYVNSLNSEYVAYLFADDAPMFGPDGDESIIKCGSYQGGTVNKHIDLGWEPQWLLIKSTTTPYQENWLILDSMRGIITDAQDPSLFAQSSEPERLSNQALVNLTPTGFTLPITDGEVNATSRTYIYMAIRRPNKPAEEFEPDELFAMADSLVVNPTFVSGFPVGMGLYRQPLNGNSTGLNARLIQGKQVSTNSTNKEEAKSDANFDYQDGYYDDLPTGRQSWMFRRAHGFFDVVTYEGDGVAGREVPHNLSAVPEMMWIKQRNSAANWMVYNSTIGATKSLTLNENYDASNDGGSYWNSVAPTSEVFTLGSHPNVNSASGDYIAFFWASVPGICDIGSYTGTSQTIDCGFTNGARFVLIKRTDAQGEWRYYDALRGIGASSSKVLFLNGTGAQQDDLHMVSNSSGFGIVAGGGTVGINGAEYIYIAIA